MDAEPFRAEIRKVQKELIKNKKIRQWARGKTVKLEVYYAFIDDAMKAAGGLSISTIHLESLVPLIKFMVDREESLYTYLVKHNNATTNDQQWDDLVEAAALVILDYYIKDIESGKWPPK